ncbi:MAG: YdiU family protein [Gammaproteobacteria bacterium HGW-Gammaproteobacteria-10]|nr:MAG: YdiU family protein [Gammaproteobacteria bacterium HGW-Gammaproteobacteria-10]
MMPSFNFDNTYARLPERFGTRLNPTPVQAPRLIKLNRNLANQLDLGLDELDNETAAALFSGNLVPEGAEPLAMAYAGHQFGNFVPQLGDGRAILLGEIIDRAGRRWDIQLKGSGQTPFSRRGDGRAALGPVLREYLISDAMHALGVPTTRALAAVTSGEPVFRETPLPGAVLTRVASSHIRIGTFQYFAMREDWEAVKLLADYAIDRHYPDLKSAPNPYSALLSTVQERQASLIARWMHVGFIHGVMNTDNMTISGETIDYGPCAFMDQYNPDTVFSSIDDFGRYAFGNQPRIAQWNLARFAETLLPLLHDEQDSAIAIAVEIINRFSDIFDNFWLAGMRRKLGLAIVQQDDKQLIDSLLQLMQQHKADYTNVFRALSHIAEGTTTEPAPNDYLPQTPDFDNWLERWQIRLDQEAGSPTQRAEAMRRVNPAYIPRNHKVEQALSAAVQEEDFSKFEALLDVLNKPFTEQPGCRHYQEPPQPDERVYQTFCGT